MFPLQAYLLAALLSIFPVVYSQADPDPCPRDGFNIQPDGATLNTVDIDTGETTVISIIDQRVDAVGFNVLDGALYAAASGSQQIVRFLEDGVTTPLTQNHYPPTLPLP